MEVLKLNKSSISNKQNILYAVRMNKEEQSIRMESPPRVEIAAELPFRRCLAVAFIYALLRWAAQPPFSLGILSFAAIVPLLILVDSGKQTQAESPRIGKRAYQAIWLGGFLFWMVSLQGIRYAHPTLYLGWIALSAYLAIYAVLFVWLLKRASAVGVPLLIAAPVLWVGCEWIRNYMLTGISACMLGHCLADFPLLIQTADLFGTYGISFLIVVVNVSVHESIRLFATGKQSGRAVLATLMASTLLAGAVLYGRHQLTYIKEQGKLTALLLGLDEQTEYFQDTQRPVEIYQAYASKSIEVALQSEQEIDVVVWPESMFGGGDFWMQAEDNAKVPPGYDITESEFQQGVKRYQAGFIQSAADLQQLLTSPNSASQTPPHLLVGCPVITYGQQEEMYSCLLHIDPSHEIEWYGKNHRVIFGEHVPLLLSIPWVESFIPPGMKLSRGAGAKTFSINGTEVAANICIETAVERVTVNHMHELHQNGQGRLPKAIVTISNDAWYDHSSVIEHHLRCAQLVAVGCRRPILSAGNGGPTAWIDSDGRIMERIPSGQAGTIIAQPKIDNRISLYVRIGDWPAAILGWLCIGLTLSPLRRLWS